jgi:hypothetical protein
MAFGSGLYVKIPHVVTYGYRKQFDFSACSIDVAQYGDGIGVIHVSTTSFTLELGMFKHFDYL